MQDEILKNFINKNFKKTKLQKLEQDASKREYYRITEYDNDRSYILLDSRNEIEQFNKSLKIYNIIKKINISIPEVYHYESDSNFMILEDFGDMRFDKLINNPKYTKNLLKIAIDSLIVLKESINKDNVSKISSYNFKNFEDELSEFVDWYLPFIYKKDTSINNKKNFYSIWKKKFNEILFNTDILIHRDFFCNNLFYLSSRNQHLKCGIIDYQDAIFGDSALDIVSLLEDSRRIIKNYEKTDLINYFLSQTNQVNKTDEFLNKLDFIGAVRQTRILGRWVKLYKLYNKKKYLNFINITWFWLEKNLNNNFMYEIKNMYENLIPTKLRKYND